MIFMKDQLKSDLVRAGGKKRIIIFSVLMCVISVLVTSSALKESLDALSNKPSWIYLTGNTFTVLPFFCACISLLLVMPERIGGLWRNKIAVGVRRRDIFLSKIIFSCSVTLIFIILHFIIIFLTGLVRSADLMPFGKAFFIFINMILQGVTFSVVFTATSFYFSSDRICIIFPLIISYVLPLFPSSMKWLIESGKIRSSILTDIVKFMKKICIYDYTAETGYASSLIKTVPVCIVICAVLLISGTVSFERKEIN